MKKICLVLLSIFFVITASVAGYATEAKVHTMHWYSGTMIPPEYSEYQLELAVWSSDSISTVTAEGPNVPLTSLEYEITLDTEQFRWTKTVNLPGKPSVGDNYSFIVTYQNSSTETFTSSVSGTIEEFPDTILPANETAITSTIPTFEWSSFSFDILDLGIVVIDIDTDKGQMIWYAKVSNDATSAVYNFDGTGTPLREGGRYIWILGYRDAANDNGANVMSMFGVEMPPDIKIQLPEITSPGTGPSLTSDGSSIYLYKHDYSGAASGKIFKINPDTGEVTSTYLLSLNYDVNGISWISSMTWYNGAIWASGGYGDSSGSVLKTGIFKIDPETSKSSNQIPAGMGFETEDEGINGLTNDGTNFYASVNLTGDVNDFGIVKFNPDQVSEIPTTPFFQFSQQPYRMCYGDNSIWAHMNVLTRINPSTGSIEGTYSIPTYAAGLYFDSMLWMYDEFDNSLKAYSPEGKLTLVEKTQSLNPSGFSLSNNFPNPFNPTTTIEFFIPRDTKISLQVYNINGQKMIELVNRMMPAGKHSVIFDAKEMPSGMYLYTLKSGGFTETKKMLLLK